MSFSPFAHGSVGKSAATPECPHALVIISSQPGFLVPPCRLVHVRYVERPERNDRAHEQSLLLGRNYMSLFTCMCSIQVGLHRAPMSIHLVHRSHPFVRPHSTK